jgi:hypothetical protein
MSVTHLTASGQRLESESRTLRVGVTDAVLASAAAGGTWVEVAE